MIDDQTIDAPATDVSAKRTNAVPLESGAASSVSKSAENEGAMGSTPPWLPGFGSALSSVGFGAMIAFSSLLSAERGLSPLWLTFSAFAIALVAARLLLGHTPDKLGGAKVALVCVFIEAGGLALIWFASNPVLAAAGAALTGFGYSLVYPGLGVEAVRRAPPQSRGLAMGAYTVFLDVALGFSSPALGLIAGWTGLGSVFLASAILVLCAAVIAAWLLRKNSLKEKQSMKGLVLRIMTPVLGFGTTPTEINGDRNETSRSDHCLALPARLNLGTGGGHQNA
jgi:MFS family permease